MPRIADPRNEAGRRRTEAYRKNEATKGRPEASHVDRAAAAVIAVSFAKRHGSKNEEALGNFADLCATLLAAQGYDYSEARQKTLERLRFRPDIIRLTAAIHGDAGASL